MNYGRNRSNSISSSSSRRGGSSASLPSSTKSSGRSSRLLSPSARLCHQLQSVTSPQPSIASSSSSSFFLTQKRNRRGQIIYRSSRAVQPNTTSSNHNQRNNICAGIKSSIKGACTLAIVISLVRIYERYTSKIFAKSYYDDHPKRNNFGPPVDKSDYSDEYKKLITNNHNKNIPLVTASNNATRTSRIRAVLSNGSSEDSIKLMNNNRPIGDIISNHTHNSMDNSNPKIPTKSQHDKITNHDDILLVDDGRGSIVNNNTTTNTRPRKKDKSNPLMNGIKNKNVQKHQQTQRISNSYSGNMDTKQKEAEVKNKNSNNKLFDNNNHVTTAKDDNNQVSLQPKSSISRVSSNDSNINNNTTKSAAKLLNVDTASEKIMKNNNNKIIKKNKKKRKSRKKN